MTRSARRALSVARDFLACALVALGAGLLLRCFDSNLPVERLVLPGLEGAAALLAAVCLF